MLLGVDALKGIHLKATDTLCGRRIVFHHVPKCAGTSVGRALRRAYILSQGTVKPHESKSAFDAAQGTRRHAGSVHDLREMMLLYLLYEDTRCVSAHVPFSDAAFKNFASTYAFVTILRDPVERFISHYRWWNRPGRGAPPPEPLEQFLKTEGARSIGSTFVRYFSGNPGAERFAPAHVEAAVNNLRRLHFVGFVDELGRFESALRTLSGRRISIGKENVGKSSIRSASISSALREEIARICAPDIEIWDAVQHLRNAEPQPVAATGGLNQGAGSSN